MNKAEKMAEEYQRDDNRVKLGPKNSFLAGVEWRDQELKQDIKTTFYEGPGNHSVYSLETLVAEREEALYQKQLKIQELEAENAGLREYKSMYEGLCK